MKNELQNPIQIYELNSGYLVILPSLDMLGPFDSRAFQKIIDSVMSGIGQDDIDKLIMEAKNEAQEKEIDFSNKRAFYFKDFTGVLAFLSKMKEENEKKS